MADRVYVPCTRCDGRGTVRRPTPNLRRRARTAWRRCRHCRGRAWVATLRTAIAPARRWSPC